MKRVCIRLAVEISSKHFESLRMLGEITLIEGDFQVAVRHLRAALALRPYDTTTHNALGKALSATGKTEAAQVHFDHVVEAEESLARMERQLQEVVERPNDIDLRYEIGSTLLKYGDPQDGVRWLKTVLEIRPDHKATLEALAAYSRTRGQPETSNF